MNVTLASGTKTLGEARQAVFDTIDERVNAKFSNAKVDNFIHQALRQITQRIVSFPVEASNSLSAGVWKVSLPNPKLRGGMSSVESASWNGDELDASAYNPVNEDSGTPTSFAVDGSTVALYPAPDSDGTLMVRFIAEYVEAHDDGDELGVPDDYVDAAVMYASYMCKLLDEEYTSAGMLRSAWESMFEGIYTLRAGVYSASDEYNYE